LAAGLGALEPPELEPLSEDDFAAAGFGAGELPPELPEGLPATLATVRTATDGAGTAGVVGLAWVGDSHVPISQTSAVAPNNTETDPARRACVRTVISTGGTRDGVGAGAEGWARGRLPPVGVTETVTGVSTGFRARRRCELVRADGPVTSVNTVVRWR
jgi:hypothetical protein